MPINLGDCAIASELLAAPRFVTIVSQPGVQGFIRAIGSAFNRGENLFAYTVGYISTVTSAGHDTHGTLADLSRELRREWGVSIQTATLGARLQELLHALNDDATLRSVLAFAGSRLGSTDPAHDIHHVLRVILWGLRIAPETVDPRHLMAAAMLHDVVNLPKSHPEARLASRMSSDVSREFLTQIGFAAPKDIELICDAIEEHSYSRGLTPSSNLGRALQDADRLDALGSTGVIRLFAVGAQLGAAPFDSEDPWAVKRPLNDKVFTLDHFFAKIFKLSSTMCTHRGRAEAEHRTAAMRCFIEGLRRELASGSAP